MTGPRLDGPLVFVDIDTQRDFLEPGRPLFLAGAPAIGPNLARLTRLARARGIPVLATACAHTLDSAEIASGTFPPHCLVGTDGQGRIAATDWPGGMVLRVGDAIEAPDPLPPHLTVEKDEFDPFGRPGLDGLIARYAGLGGGSTFVVYGVATDYCVRAAVDGLLARGRPTALVVDAIRPVVPGDEPAILAEFAARGVLLTLADVVAEAAGAGHAR